MIDIENELFTIIATSLRSQFPGIYVAGEYVAKPSSMPAVFIVQQDSAVNRRGRSNDETENYTDVMFQVEVFSNKNMGRKAEAKEIMMAIDTEFAERGFTRTSLLPVPNMNDATIYRLVARYTATIGKDNQVYWR